MRLAILGGGQLGRMLAIAARRLDVEPWVVDPKPEAPAAAVAHHVLGALDDAESLRAVAHCDVATAELEHVPAPALAWLSRRMPLRPAALAFHVAGDRLREKQLFRRLGIPTAPFARVDAPADLERALRRIGAPALLKTRHAGYDGRGQAPVRSLPEAGDAWRALGGRPALLEGLVRFEREISILAVRGVDGEVRFWNAVENRHRDGILRSSRPLGAGDGHPLVAEGREAVRALLRALDYVGVLAVEFFEVGGRLWANEMACRVHNSGHWTEEGAETSQFENHVRAVCGWPLGDTRLLGPTAMVNLVGEVPSREALLRVPGARLHLYGKSPAPGRKLGHLTLRAGRREELDAALQTLETLTGHPFLRGAPAPRILPVRPDAAPTAPARPREGEPR